jgi:hypothetical protein
MIATLALIVVLTGCADLPAGAQQSPEMLQPEVERRAVEQPYPVPEQEAAEVTPVVVLDDAYPVPDDDDCYTKRFAGNADARDPRPHKWSTAAPVQVWIADGTITVQLTGRMTTDPRSEKESLAVAYLGRSPAPTRLEPGSYTLEAWGDSALFICPAGVADENASIAAPGEEVQFPVRGQAAPQEQAAAPQAAAPQAEPTPGRTPIAGLGGPDNIEEYVNGPKEMPDDCGMVDVAKHPAVTNIEFDPGDLIIGTKGVQVTLPDGTNADLPAGLWVYTVETGGTYEFTYFTDPPGQDFVMISVCYR